MPRITRYLVVAVLMAVALNGCVSQGKYQVKEDEAKGLSGELVDLKQQYGKLSSDNNALKAEYDKLKGEATGLAKENQALAKDKSELEQVLKAKTDTHSKNISDLRQKVADLQDENRKLGDEIAVLQKAKEENVKEVGNTYEHLLENMKSEIAQGQVTISELKGKLTVSMEAAILFDSGKADINPDGIAVLLKMVPTLKEVKDKSIRIEGHTDNMPIKSAQFPSNWELSAVRATNVAKYLQQQGLDPANLSAAAFSEFKPVADNATKEGRARNRRIEINLAAKE